MTVARRYNLRRAWNLRCATIALDTKSTINEVHVWEWKVVVSQASQCSVGCWVNMHVIAGMCSWYDRLRCCDTCMMGRDFWITSVQTTASHLFCPHTCWSSGPLQCPCCTWAAPVCVPCSLCTMSWAAVNTKTKLPLLLPDQTEEAAISEVFPLSRFATWAAFTDGYAKSFCEQVVLLTST